MANLYSKNFNDADEVKNPPKAKVQVVKLGNVNASKLVLEPGWKWSECIKPTVGGDSCQAGHVGEVISGRLACTHDDGSEIVALIAELEEFTFNEVLPVRVVRDVDNLERALLISP